MGLTFNFFLFQPDFVYWDHSEAFNAKQMGLGITSFVRHEMGFISYSENKKQSKSVNKLSRWA